MEIMQDKSTRLMTEMRVDHFNKQVTKGKPLKGDELQKDQFMKLLVAELKHQNPMDPMKDRDFIAQMAQLTGLEKMEKVRDGMERLITNNSNTATYSLLGRKVTFVNDRGKEEVGAVSAVEFQEGQALIQVNKTLISNKQITKVE
jgi:flagellar basal-body rod modification protein FlgD